MGSNEELLQEKLQQVLIPRVYSFQKRIKKDLFLFKGMCKNT